MEVSRRIGLKIKTMDNHFIDVVIDNHLQVKDLKNIILQVHSLVNQQSNIALEKQRLVFRGKLLKDEDVIAQTHLEDGNVVHLIASMEVKEQAPAPENPQQTETAPPEAPLEDETLGDTAEQEILAGILRTLSKRRVNAGDTSLNRRNHRRRVLQQRTSGFNISGTEGLRIIEQNLSTLEQLEQACKTENDLFPLNRFDLPSIFEFENRKLKLGQWIDVKDTIDQWVSIWMKAVGG
jgi:hypothetical protein